MAFETLFGQDGPDLGCKVRTVLGWAEEKDYPHHEVTGLVGEKAVLNLLE
jgi:hypothetical protein